MILYRATNKQEMDLLINNQSLKFSFKKRYKWFSSNLSWIKNRVQNESFNNSKFIKDRYSHLLKFNINDNYLSKFNKIGYKEMMLDVRKSNFPIINIKEVV